MIINVFSYENAIANLDKHPENWISIRDYGYSHVYKELDEYGSNILEVYFDDVTEYNIKCDTLHPFYKRAYMRRGLVCFDEEMAKLIIDFANDIYKKDEELNIHCWAGKSRSQAVGYCLNQYYNLYLSHNKNDFLRNIENNMDMFLGNYDVIRIMTNVLYNK